MALNTSLLCWTAAAAAGWTSPLPQQRRPGTGSPALGKISEEALPPGDRLKILLVEDDADWTEIAVAWLSPNYEVEVADDGLVALEKIAQNEYDVLILDWDLPGASGLTICQKYRAAGGTAPVLITTGRSAIAEKGEGFDSGADDYITKPFALEELSLRIKALLRRVAQRPQPERAAEQGSLVGTVLSNRYELISELGSGGMGTVYLARHTTLGRSYALKLLNAQQLHDQIQIKRFEREAKAASTLSHPNLITVYDFGFTNFGQPFLVMDYLAGQGLDQVVHGAGPISLMRFVKLFSQICDGLSHAHSKGIIHRDLKPSNIMIIEPGTDSEIAKVVDFGIAKLTSQAEAVQQLTQDGEFFGSPLYMSPEQSQSSQLDSRSDIYSLGCVMYEAVTGQRPLVGDSALQTVLKHLSERPKPLNAVRPDLNLPESLERVIFKAMEKSTIDRYQSMSEMKTAVESLR